MKATTLLLAASLVGNIALATLMVTRTNPGASIMSAPNLARKSADGAADKSGEALRAALASGDAAALAAAGVPPEVARELMIGRTFARMAEKLRATRARQGS